MFPTPYSKNQRIRRSARTSKPPRPPLRLCAFAPLREIEVWPQHTRDAQVVSRKGAKKNRSKPESHARDELKIVRSSRGQGERNHCNLLSNWVEVEHIDSSTFEMDDCVSYVETRDDSW